MMHRDLFLSKAVAEIGGLANGWLIMPAGNCMCTGICIQAALIQSDK